MGDENKVSKWVPFWFESNGAWGMAEDKEKWEEIKNNYFEHHKDSDRSNNEHLRAAQRAVHSIKDHNFGFRHEHRGKETLGEFLDKHKMTI